MSVNCLILEEGKKMSPNYPLSHWLALSALLLPSTAFACEPMAVAIIMVGPSFISQSLWGMGLVVLAKCVAFGLYEKRIPFFKGASSMLLGNVISTLAGIGIAMPFMAPSSLFVFLPVMVVLSCLPPSRRLFLFLGKPNLGSVSAIGIIITSMFLCGLFFFLAKESLDQENLTQYWLLKIVYVAFGFLIGIGITTIYEEWVIFKLHPPQEGEPYYMKSVFYANLMAFLVAGGIGAMLMLPKRLQSANFLVEILREWFSAVV